MMLLFAPSAFALDIAPYQAALHQHVDDRGRVDYPAMKADAGLATFIEQLAQADEPARPADRMAFWINAYNAITIDMVADHYPLGSVKELDGGDPWSARMFTVAGRTVTLNHIEHQILRPLGDARVHAALNCASLGCPPLQRSVFTGDSLDRQLDAAARDWMGSNGITIDLQSSTVMLSRIFEWYSADFIAADPGGADIPGVDDPQEAALHFAMRYLPQPHTASLSPGGYTVSSAPYDWGLNAR